MHVFCTLAEILLLPYFLSEVLHCTFIAYHEVRSGEGTMLFLPVTVIDFNLR